MKYFYLGLGWIFLALGVIGIFLPVLPTTPFLIVAAYCFNRGSDRFYAWLMNHPLLGPPVRDWHEHQMIRTKYKVLATTMIAVTSAFLYPRPDIPLFGKIAYGVVTSAALVYVWSRRGG